MRKLMWFTLGFGAACAWGAYFANQHAVSNVDVKLLKKLGVGLTCEPKYEEQKLYH